MLNIKKINILWKTPCDYKLNLDSITHWKNDILVSSKSTHFILGFNKDTGKLKYKIGGKGNDYDEFNRPNGILVLGDYLFVVERDNKRCQIINMNNKKSIAFFGLTKFKKPYGITGIMFKSQYIIFITDNELKTIFKYNIKINKNTNKIKKIKSYIYMELSGTDLESILLDHENKKLLVADEKYNKIRIFDYNSVLIHEITNIFKGEPEGIAMTDKEYIFTDQLDDTTYFHVYNKKTMQYLYSYNNSLVSNTDGIDYDGKYLYAIDDDCSLVKLNLSQIQVTSLLPTIIITGLLVSVIKQLN